MMVSRPEKVYRGLSRLAVSSKANHQTPCRHSLSTVARLQHPAAKSPYPHLLYRNPERPLPSLESLSPSRRWLRTVPIFLLVVACSALGIFNYQKVNSPIITATLYALRTNATARHVLGDEVYFASKWAWIQGEINLVQGRVDVAFSVKGKKQSAVCRFKAHRVGGRSGRFVTTEWSLETADGQTIHLLDRMSHDPLQGANF